MTEITISNKVITGLYVVGALIALCLVGLVLKYLRLLYEILCGALTCIHKYLCCESKCCKKNRSNSVSSIV
jgi:hypothetical protein